MRLGGMYPHEMEMVNWLRSRAFEIVMVLTVIAGIIVVAVTTRAQTTPTWPTSPSSTLWVYPQAPPGGRSQNWIIQTVGPNYNPVFVRDTQRVYLVDDDGGVRRCR